MIKKKKVLLNKFIVSRERINTCTKKKAYMQIILQAHVIYKNKTKKKWVCLFNKKLKKINKTIKIVAVYALDAVWFKSLINWQMLRNAPFPGGY